MHTCVDIDMHIRRGRGRVADGNGWERTRDGTSGRADVGVCVPGSVSVVLPQGMTSRPLVYPETAIDLWLLASDPSDPLRPRRDASPLHIVAPSKRDRRRRRRCISLACQISTVAVPDCALGRRTQKMPEAGWWVDGECPCGEKRRAETRFHSSTTTTDPTRARA